MSDHTIHLDEVDEALLEDAVPPNVDADTWLEVQVVQLLANQRAQGKVQEAQAQTQPGPAGPTPGPGAGTVTNEEMRQARQDAQQDAPDADGDEGAEPEANADD